MAICRCSIAHDYVLTLKTEVPIFNHLCYPFHSCVVYPCRGFPYFRHHHCHYSPSMCNCVFIKAPLSMIIRVYCRFQQKLCVRFHPCVICTITNVCISRNIYLSIICILIQKYFDKYINNSTTLMSPGRARFVIGSKRS